MKILAINASYRGNRGYNHFLVNKIFNGAREEGAECEEILLSKLKINHCIACNKCQTKESYLKCIYEDKDDVRKTFNKMSEADIIIYATPVYVFTMSALLKIFLDRLYSTGDVKDFKLSESGLFFHSTDETICKKTICSSCLL